MMRHYEIGIIGAGASGMAAALAAAEARPGCSIVLAERNTEPGKKLLATGNGRCNYLNSRACAGDYYSDEGGEEAARLIEAVFDEVPVACARKFLKNTGIEPYEEEDGRMYPRSNQASSVQRALHKAVMRAGITLLAPFWARKVERQRDGGFIVTSDDDRSFMCDKLILTTGGKAGIQYGSSGDGYRFAMEMGCGGVKPVPALTSLVCTQEMDKLAGVRAKGRVTLYRNENGAECWMASDSGEIQFTKEGISGICTFNVSRFYRIAEGRSHRVLLDLFEEFDEAALEAEFFARRQRFAEERADVMLLGMLPEKLGAYLLNLAGVTDARTLCGSLDDACLQRLARLGKALEFNIIGTGMWKDCQVTAGGLLLSECKDTLESFKVPGLYLAGEILDVDGPCGGYNLSWAFCSGILAGRSAAQG